MGEARERAEWRRTAEIVSAVRRMMNGKGPTAAELLGEKEAVEDDGPRMAEVLRRGRRR